jgi:O-antigen ligase
MASATPQQLALAWLLPLATLATLTLVAWPQRAGAAAAVLAALVLLPALGLWLVARAGQGGKLALAAIAAAIVLLSDSTWRGAGPERGFDVQSLAKFCVWTLGLLLVFWRRDLLVAALRHAPSRWFAVFGLWAVLGVTWSATPAYTAAASLALLGMWTLAVALAGALPVRLGLRMLALALMGALALSLLLWALNPAQALTAMEGGRLLRLSGIFGSPNNLGRAAALLVLLTVLAAPGLPALRRALWLIAGVSLGVTCLVYSQSRTPVMALGLALALALLVSRPRLALAAAAAAGVLATLAALVLLAVPECQEAAVRLAARSDRAEELSSFTGRTDIWTAVWQLIQQAPWLGHGFASSREVLPAGFQGAYGWTTSSAHNLWLQAWLTTGAVGLGLLLLGQAAWLRAAFRRPLAAREAVVAFVLVVGVFEASALGPSVNLMTFVLCWALALGLRSHDD